ncbi:CU044_2847 family protein [Streptomyces sp. 8N616]|uniref:CU044_2847 family protein n=1 Tax=Streptomyces sp. 8N616 TaxID=3457414 RepID=UPI003FD1AE5B
MSEDEPDDFGAGGDGRPGQWKGIPVGQLFEMTLDGSGAQRAVFEVDGDLMGTDLELAAGEGTVARARVSLHDALEQVKPTLSRVAGTVRELKPDEAEIEFGLKMGGETGVIIAKGTAEVNFAVRLVWNRP